MLLLLLACEAPANAEGNMEMESFEVGPVRDRRFTEIRHLDLTYTFAAPSAKKAWEQRAEHLRRQILVGAGLHPMPEKTLLNAKVFGRIERDDYTIEKVYFESFPGSYVTGNLYRPKGKTGPFPAVLNPHGHWQRGRLENIERGSIPGRCINFAKQGYIAFSYDMVGYNDSSLPDHRSGQLDGIREHLWGISIGGVQLWNSIRAVDFLLTLPDVDGTRIACTGASGGGTQTFLVTAVDDRIRVAAPVNMISSTMQGGCQCENPPGIRVDTNNMEIGALAAPRPLLLVSATGDWTANTPAVEFPAIQRVYKLFDADAKVACVRMDAEHNYNKDSREAVYAWLGRWILDNPDARSFKERPFEVEKDEDLLVFADEPRPSNALDAAGFIESRISAAERQIEAAKPDDLASLNDFRAAYGPALKHSLGLEQPGGIAVEDRGSSALEGCSVQKLVLGRKGKGDAIPALLFAPAKAGAKAPATLVVHSRGTRALLDGGRPGSLIEGLLGRGHLVLTIDCFGTGEHVAPAGTPDRTTRYKFFDTYNRTDTAERVQDILTAIAFLQNRKGTAAINLVGRGEAGLWCLLARAFAPKVQRTAVDTAGFDMTSDQAFIRKLYAPCLRRAGDLRTAGALIAPGNLFIHNTRGRFKTGWVEDMYQAAGDPSALRIRGTHAPDKALVEWLLAGE